MRLSILTVFLLLSIPAFAFELFRYRGAARDGGTLEYIFEADKEDLPQTVAKEKVAEIAADFMTTFYHIQIGALETAGVSHHAGSVLARLILRGGPRTCQANVFCRRSA